jgi:hypothetical protein
VRHVPVDLVPGRRNFRGHSVPEYLGDRGEQVLVHDRVLSCRDAKRRVLMGDAREHRVRVGPVLVDEQRGIGRDGGRQGALLVALRLVAPVEQVPLQFGVRCEHPPVEDARDVAKCGADRGQGGTDGLRGGGREHA